MNTQQSFAPRGTLTPNQSFQPQANQNAPGSLQFNKGAFQPPMGVQIPKGMPNPMAMANQNSAVRTQDNSQKAEIVDQLNMVVREAKERRVKIIEFYEKNKY